MVCPVPFASLRPHARRDVVERTAACYQEASASEKGLLLDTVIAVSGYTRKYAIRLLNQSSKTTSLDVRPRSSLYGLEVQEALVFAWKVSDRICTKRLIPFLPTLVNFLERYGYLCLSEESRATLLAMSVATADRLLQASRDEKPHGLSTTKAGSLLKQQIPLRTFHDWNDTQPGFVEADLVAHCAGQTEGGSLFTLTLTDVATGWTECLPLLYRSSDAVIGALTQARKLFPFPILGIDTDNGAEFINEDLLAYCEREHLTFTRGRPDLKSDQCFVEQKNGAIVRHFVGYERFVGQQAYQQLREVYRAVRLYVNCFQPSMKLQFKEVNEHGVRRVYDTARTPLQRVLLSGVLSEGRQRELQVAAEALDPVALFEQVKQLQQALSRFAIGSMCSPQNAGGSCVLLFSSASSLMDSQAALASDVSRPVSELPSLRQVRDGSSHMSALDWPRSLRDPFAGEWEYILSLILAHPECSGGEIFRALQRRSPGRYRPAHAVTLQRGVRKIRARLQATIGEAWPQEVIQGSVPPSVPGDEEFQWKDEVLDSGTPVLLEAEEQGEEHRDEDRRRGHEQQVHRLTMTIEGAIRRYLEQQREAGRRRKTLEWHQMALTVLEQYLRSERGLHFVSQIKVEEIEAWIECLRRLPTRTERPREASTIGTYARSVRAFCNWAIQQGYLERTPVGRGNRATKSQLVSHVLNLDDFDRLQQACGSALEKAEGRNWAAWRNCAVVWILYETGMKVSELCALRLVDVDEEQGKLLAGRGGNERWIALSAQGWQHVSRYVKQRRFMQGAEEERQQDSLFCTEWGDSLTGNAITLLFARLKKRIGMKRGGVSPLMLRESFAVRYLQGGGEPETLRELLGLTSMAGVKHYQRLYTQLIEKDQQKDRTEEGRSGSMADQAKKPKRERRSSSRAGKKTDEDTRQEASGSGASVSKQKNIQAHDGS